MNKIPKPWDGKPHPYEWQAGGMSGSWKCEKHGMTWDIGCPCASCHMELRARVEEQDKWLCDFVDGWVGVTDVIFQHYRERAEKAEARLRTEAAAHAMTHGALEAERTRSLDFAARVIGLDP